jgi:hypothetical protein
MYGGKFGDFECSNTTTGYSGCRLEGVSGREQSRILSEKIECALATLVDDGQRAGFRN